MTKHETRETTMLSQALGLTTTRIALEMILFGHGYFLKVETFTIDGTVGFFASLGFPSLAEYLVIVGEILGGIA